MLRLLVKSFASSCERFQREFSQREPFPAVVMDRCWNMLMDNESTPRFLNPFTVMAVRKSSRNIRHHNRLAHRRLFVIWRPGVQGGL
jgi:hypothetical protein